MARVRPRTEVKAQPATVSGSADAPVLGTGAPQAQPATTIANGTREITGSGAPAAQSSMVAGYSGLPGVLGTLVQENETPEQITLYLPIVGSLDAGSTAYVEHRINAISAWQPAHPLFRLESAAPGGEAFTGVIFDLVPGQSYEVRVTVTDPTLGTEQQSGTFNTRAWPSAAGAATSSVSNQTELDAALLAAAPGDVIEMAAGTYAAGAALSASGSAGNPVYLRGENIDAVVLEGASDVVEINASNVVFENCTVNRTGAAALGTRGIRLRSTGAADNVTIRNVKIVGFARGVQTANGETLSGCSLYNCEIIGQADWNTTNLTTSTYWSEDGVRLVGTGNCVWNCTLIGFGDSITFAHSEADDIRSNFAFRNFIRRSVDDCFEFDHHGRNNGAYDNYCENIKTCLSVSDANNYGPIYYFRNINVNVALRILKPNDDSWGLLRYNNTYLRQDSPDGAYTGSTTRGNGDLEANTNGQDKFARRNELLIVTGKHSR